jgi:hypothetical protein
LVLLTSHVSSATIKVAECVFGLEPAHNEIAGLKDRAMRIALAAGEVLLFNAASNLLARAVSKYEFF